MVRTKVTQTDDHETITFPSDHGGLEGYFSGAKGLRRGDPLLCYSDLSVSVGYGYMSDTNMFNFF